MEARVPILGAMSALSRSNPVLSSSMPEAVSIMASHWSIDPRLTFLNHGSYGAVPNKVMKVQSDLRARVEWDAVRFYKVDLERLMDEMRVRVGAFVNCPPETIAPMVNATVAIATVLASIDWKPGDEILVTDHEYMSGVNELGRIAAARGVKVVTAKVPFPMPTGLDEAGSEDLIVRAIEGAVTPRTRLAMVSWITSATSLIFPIARIVKLLRSRGVETLVDGTHAPGQIAVDIESLDPDYFVGSFHKWVSAPKGTGFLYVPVAKQAGFRPVCLSSRAHKVRPERALFLRDFDYMGTDDYTGILSVPAAIDFFGELLPGGWDAVYAANHELVMKGRRVMCAALGIEEPAAEGLIGSMATIPLPDPPAGVRATLYDDALQDALVERHGCVTPIWSFQTMDRSGPTRVLRISAQVYNRVEDYERLAGAVVEELGREMGREKA
jgi:isopenicillin-N epimerase